MRDLSYTTNITSHMSAHSHKHTPIRTVTYPARIIPSRPYLRPVSSLAYSPLVTSAWQLQNMTSLLVTATTVERETSVYVQFLINGTNYGLTGVCQLTRSFPLPQMKMGEFPCVEVSLSVRMPPRAVYAWTITN